MAELTTKQKAALLGWAAEGLRLEAINKLAAEFDPPFEATWYQLKRARLKSKTKYGKLRDKAEAEMLEEGLARKAVRIARLIEMAEKLEQDLFGKRLWVKEPKQIGDEIRDVKRFNAAEVREYRALLEDIARELGQRSAKIEHSGRIDVTKLSDEELKALLETEG